MTIGVWVRRRVPSLMAILMATSAPASMQPAFPPGWRFLAGSNPAVSTGGMVVTADSAATRVGVEILERGGNAVDAAVAVCFALAVTFPEAGNLGGGGFLLLRTSEGETRALDFRETAPRAATREMFLDAKGEPTDRSLYGALAAGVPGTVMGMSEVHHRYGRLPWSDVVEPAFRLAQGGFRIGGAQMEAFEHLAWLLSSFSSREDFATTRELFLPAGEVPALGSIFRQPNLAATLRRIADLGPDGFYRGETARMMVEEIEKDGGIITPADLEQYTAVWREPLVFGYRGSTILTMPPVSSGGATMAEIANILAGYDLDFTGWESAERIHLFVEAAKRAYADRNRYLGDPAFVEMPIERMVSTTYAEQRRNGIRLGVATPSTEIAAGLEAVDRNGETTHYSIVDRVGNAVVVTTTINTRFGCLVTAGKAGFLLNNEMDDFTSRPGIPNYYGLVQGEANAIEPGKRMLSSMTPTIVLDREERLLLLTGTPGGSTIITTVFQTISNLIDHQMSIADAVAAPRYHHQHLPDLIQYEVGGISLETFESLVQMGHSFRPVVAIGNVQAIRIRPDGSRAGMSDPRGAGLALGTKD